MLFVCGWFPRLFILFVVVVVFVFFPILKRKTLAPHVCVLHNVPILSLLQPQVVPSFASVENTVQ